MQVQLQLLKKEMRLNRNLLILVGGVVFAVGLSSFVSIPEHYPDNTKIFLNVVFALVLIFGCYLLVKGLRRFPIEKESTISLLMNQSDKVVWIYSYVVENMPFGIRTLKLATIYVHLSDGSIYTFNVRAKKLAKAMLELNVHLPHTTFGHSTQKEQLFRANPMLLYRSGS